MLIDTHVHLNSHQFNDTVDEVINRALANDVKKMIVVGFDHQTNKRAIELAEQYDFIYATVGFHPQSAIGATTDHQPSIGTQCWRWFWNANIIYFTPRLAWFVGYLRSLYV